jgi:cysteinyl-tRNA synthetase
MLTIYNSLTRAKQRFVALTPGQVGMYVCGMTVYDFCHLGHARVLVVFDLVSRWLMASGYQVTYVRNITDIDDKIIRRALDNGEPFEQLTGRFIEAMNDDATALGVRKPDLEPRATENIPQMLKLIGALIQKGIAYPADNGDVYYAVHKFDGYGKLSGKSLDQLRAGARVDVDPNKREPLDFVLWKAAKAGEPSWDSPWGKGRPGWHIECSAMSERYLGTHFDIHGGGQDLQFPHHENEIAQSEGVHGHTFVNYWMHNGFVRIDDEKMSKSLGNFFTVREILDRYDAEVVRFFIARAHYRSPLNYSDHHLDDARQALTRLYTALKGFDFDSKGYEIDWGGDYSKRFREAMDDDFNTPEAVAVLFELANEVNRSRSRELARLLQALGAVLGLLERDPVDYLQSGDSSDLSAEQIEVRIIARRAARKDKNFAEADRIRDELLSMGVVLEDGSDGTTWRRS